MKKNEKIIKKLFFLIIFSFFSIFLFFLLIYNIRNLHFRAPSNAEIKIERSILIRVKKSHLRRLQIQFDIRCHKWVVLSQINHPVYNVFLLIFRFFRKVDIKLKKYFFEKKITSIKSSSLIVCHLI